MSERMEEIENKIDLQEQYSRRNCILIHEIAENKEENTDQIDRTDIDRYTHVLTRETKKSRTYYSEIC